ncbi:MAG TPA: SDR family NAD(P)-dependent oxidoreductase [Marmoricola sp.]|nr:SDR family NAD(P)-dependent oxidoreductase [Marmoricola sp.]
MGTLTGKVVAVTGGAQGIGAATAAALANAGARVAVGDLDTGLAEQSAAPYGGLALPLDVTSTESWSTFTGKVEGELGPIDALVNNAGIMVIGRHLEVPLEHQLRQLDVNLRGVILGCHTIAPAMVARGSGRIVNIASVAGRIPTPGTAVYSATKVAVQAFTEALDGELRGHGVRASTVLPAFTRTALIDGTTAPKASPPIEPEQVADAVVAQLRRYRATTVVPKQAALGVVQWALLPAPAKSWISRRLGLDTMFTDFDHAARADYERRSTVD